MNKLYRRYDRFMRGKDAETLEDTMISILEQLKDLNAKDRANKDMMKSLSKQVKDSFQKFGFVKYNAFKGMGGNLSFVLAMLDDNNTGFVLDAVHSREGCYLYLKEVEEGATEADKARVEKEIKEMPNYFADYDTTVNFISEEELLRDHSGIPHGGFVFRTGKTGWNNEFDNVIEYSLKLDSNPAFTSSVIVAYARAVFRMYNEGMFGCKTVFDVPPAYLTSMSAEEIRAHLL